MAKPENERTLSDVRNLISGAEIALARDGFMNCGIGLIIKARETLDAILARQTGEPEPVAWRAGSWIYADPDTYALHAEYWAANHWTMTPLYAAPPPAEAQARVEALEALLAEYRTPFDPTTMFGVAYDTSRLKLLDKFARLAEALLSPSTPKPARVGEEDA